MKNAKTLEEALDEIKVVIEELERSDISLNDSFKLYNDGMKLLKYCNDAIDKVEKKIIVLNNEDE